LESLFRPGWPSHSKLARALSRSRSGDAENICEKNWPKRATALEDVLKEVLGIRLSRSGLDAEIVQIPERSTLEIELLALDEIERETPVWARTRRKRENDMA
jgi:hypothetical protein